MSMYRSIMSRMSRSLGAVALLSACLPVLGHALSINPIISRGKTVYTSSGNAANLVDGKYQGQSFSVSAGTWIAIKLEAGPSKIFLSWNSPADAWSNALAPSGCPTNNSMPVDYDILTSANSTNGSDGTWTPAASITGNYVIARGHLIPFDGASWVKMAFKKGGGSIDEVEVHDASQGADDTWFLLGTSITQMAFKTSIVVPNFADQVAAAHPGRHPAVIRGGIGCINSSDMVRNLSKYLAAAGSAHFWGIEMGTNDGWNNGNANVPLFTKNMQTVIDSCKAAGIVPVIAHALATDPSRTGGWQLHPDYAKAVDSLVAKNHLPTGPDFYAYFKAHPSELRSDGVHPADPGAAGIQKLWAEAAGAVYAGTGLSRRPDFALPEGSRLLSLRVAAGRLDMRAAAAGTAYLYDPEGRLLDRIGFAAPGEASKPMPAAFCIIRFVSAQGLESTPVPAY